MAVDRVENTHFIFFMVFFLITIREAHVSLSNNVINNAIYVVYIPYNVLRIGQNAKIWSLPLKKIVKN